MDWQYIKWDIKVHGFWKWAGYRIDEFLINPIRWRVKDFMRFLSWFPIIWKDYDSDYTDLLRVVDFKLARMARTIKKGYASSGHKRTKIGEINEVRKLLKPLINYTDFAKKEKAAHDKKWGKLNITTTPIEKSPVGPGACQMHFNRPKAKTARQKKQETKEFLKMYKLEDKRRQELYDKLFSLMAKNIQGWWD